MAGEFDINSSGSTDTRTPKQQKPTGTAGTPQPSLSSEDNSGSVIYPEYIHKLEKRIDLIEKFLIHQYKSESTDQFDQLRSYKKGPTTDINTPIQDPLNQSSLGILNEPSRPPTVGTNDTSTTTFTDEELSTIAENVQLGNLEQHWNADSNTNMQESNPSINSLIRSLFFERPEASLYSVSLGLMMVSLFLSSPTIALAGVVTLITTILHYAR
ncbi:MULTISPECIES: hypothetical protein [unclassified Haloarcula]|uniref:hypothetical protein n=1 Tax=unclassified Haloarcula TaxID=2624677 RepID=UPI000B07B2B7|nr:MULTISPECIES: hypothetical protein [unclassified Haloarcula]